MTRRNEASDASDDEVVKSDSIPWEDSEAEEDEDEDKEEEDEEEDEKP